MGADLQGAVRRRSTRYRWCEVGPRCLVVATSSLIDHDRGHQQSDAELLFEDGVGAAHLRGG